MAQMETGCFGGLELKIIEGGKKKTKEKEKAKREK